MIGMENLWIWKSLTRYDHMDKQRYTSQSFACANSSFYDSVFSNFESHWGDTPHYRLKGLHSSRDLNPKNYDNAHLFHNPINDFGKYP
jgi:hypothetical protein